VIRDSRHLLRRWLDRILALVTREPRDRAALIELLRRAEARNLIDPDALIMIEGAIQIYDLQARDVMVPRVQMAMLRNDAKREDIIQTVLESGHSRFPVIGDDPNDVIGILLAKDLLAYFSDKRRDTFDIKDVMRPAVFIPESKRISFLLREFRVSRNHMAIVVNEYGVAGLVTIEDVIEEIVGEIEDEHDLDEEVNIRQHGRNRYTINAITPIDEFNGYFQTNLSSDQYETIGGMVVGAFGHVPLRGESIDFEGFNVKVLRADKRRVQLLRFARIRPQDKPD
jgi:magnesium and cobalt transporter